MKEVSKELSWWLITIGQIPLAYLLKLSKSVTDFIDRKFDSLWRF
jgi:hypothetical protein